jgi:hypothetical protein
VNPAFNNLIPRSDLPDSYESSSLQSMREPGSLLNSWKRNQAVRIRGERLTSSVSQLQRRMSHLAIPNQSLSNYHPFKIYQLPIFFRTAATDVSKAWRTFRVRSGLILTTNANGVLPDGTDLIQTPHDEVFVTSKSGVTLSNNYNVAAPNATDIQVPASMATYWFWIEIRTDGTAVIRYGNDPTVSTYSDGEGNTTWTSTNPWTAFPTIDGNHIPVGYVDTLTGVDFTTAYVRQYLISDIISGSGSCPFG